MATAAAAAAAAAAGSRALRYTQRVGPRSLLCVSNTASAYRRAAGVKADAYILDLEDAVPWSRKAEVRDFMCETAPQVLGDKSLFVRVNALIDHDCVVEDITKVTAGLGTALSAFIVPKVCSAADVREYEQLILEAARLAGAEAIPEICCLLETADSVGAAHDILTASRLVSSMILGTADLAADVGVTQTVEFDTWARDAIGFAAATAGVQNIDTPFIEIDNHSGFARSCQDAVARGCTGKMLLFPTQVPITHQIFTPSDAEVAHARDLVSRIGHDGGSGAHRPHHHTSRRFQGPPHVAMARHVLARARIYAERDAGTGAACEGSAQPREMKHATVIEGGLDFDTVKVGSVIHSEHAMTITDGILSSWNAAFFNGDRSPSVNATMSQLLGNNDLVMPYSMLLAMAISLMVSRVTEPAIVHLGAFDGKQLAQVHVGDTIRAKATVVGATRSSAGNILLDTKHELVNQDGVTVFHLFKRTKFDRYVAPQLELSDSLPAARSDEAGGAGDAMIASIVKRAKREAIADAGLVDVSSPQLSVGQILAHRMIKVFGWSEINMMNNQFKYTNRHHLDRARYARDDILVPGPVGVSAAMGNTSLELGTVFHSYVESQLMTNKVIPMDMMASLSMVCDIQPVPGNPELEEVSLCTLGIKNVDLDTFQTDTALPVDLFKWETLRAGQLEAICRESCMILHHNIANRTLWKVTRLKAVEDDRTSMKGELLPL